MIQEMSKGADFLIQVSISINKRRISSPITVEAD